MKTNIHASRLFASAIEPLERRVCISDASGVTAYGSVIAESVHNIIARLGTDATVTVQESGNGLLYVATKPNMTGTWVMYSGASTTIQFGQVALANTGVFSVTVVRSASVLVLDTPTQQHEPQNDPAPTAAPKKSKAAKSDPAPAVVTPSDRQAQPDAIAQVALATMPRTQMVEAADRSHLAGTVEAALSRGEESGGRFIPTTTAASSSPVTSSTLADAPLLQHGGVLGAAGTSAFALGAAIAPVSEMVDHSLVTSEAIAEVQAVPQQAMATVTTVLATAAPRYFGYAPLNAPYTLLADSIAAFADRSASLSAAVVADARVGGPWTLAAGVLAADVIALAYIHRRRLRKHPQRC